MLKDFVTSGTNSVPTAVSTTSSSGADGFMSDSAVEKLKLAKELKERVENTAIQGVLYVREAVSKGGNFRKRYVSVTAGRLDIYKDESDLHNQKDPLTQKPVKLYLYRFSKNASEFTKKFVNIGNAFKEKVVGTKDFYLQDVLSAGDVNLDLAYEKYRFALLPLNVDELNSREPIEFVATDDSKFQAWEEVLSSVVEAYALMRNPNLTVKDTMLTGGNVSMASYIQAASADLDRQ
jgi:hypothetical protein